ncbi:copper chaperone [Bradyrhizobium sp. 2TAF24]|uniref:copper chaperone n=1 Tax=Bradyrhizobium sp. 2TAF24 TaxID=3233011 RepID=UPI003F8F3D80
MPEQVSRQVFFAVSALLFAGSLAATVLGCRAMAAAGIAMRPCGWTMALGWTPMPGQSWPAAAASFIGMWSVMMIAMMLPSLLPALWHMRVAISRAGGTSPDREVLLAGLGYFLVWCAVGVVVLPLAVAVAAIGAALPAPGRDGPVVVGLVVVLAGVVQFSVWKLRHLDRCREAAGCDGAVLQQHGAAFRSGLRLGRHCLVSCAGAVAILVVTGGMDLVAMALVTMAIGMERLAPGGMHAARIVGAVAIAAGGWLMMAGAG